jgi:hypothetical protein
VIGSLAGLVNFLNFYFRKLISNNNEVIRHILSGIGAAILVPLLLNMLSSDLINFDENYNKISYFVFAGFCFVAGYFSDRFINSIGEKILKDLENTKSQVNKVISETKENEEKLDILVSNESEIEEDTIGSPSINFSEFKAQNKFDDDEIKTRLDKVVNTFKGKYKFRSIKGIAKELNYPENIVKIILEGLEKEGATKRFVGKDGKTLWALTKIGQLLGKK